MPDLDITSLATLFSELAQEARSISEIQTCLEVLDILNSHQSG